jgi:ABC-type branched-subunit amino acid transport system substrate-binding protein
MKRTILQCSLVLTVICGFLLAATSRIQAQGVAGVSDNEILIGSCSALEGPSHFLGTETVTGAKAYFAMINDAGRGRAQTETDLLRR